MTSQPDDRPLRVLFVCSMNQRRSRTAEDMYRGAPGLEVASGGTWNEADHPVGIRDLEWTDLVLVMEGEHRRTLEEMFGRESVRGKLTVLGVPDEWYRGDKALQKFLRARIDPVLERALAQRRA